MRVEVGNLLEHALIEIATMKPNNLGGTVDVTQQACPVCERMIEIAKRALIEHWRMPRHFDLMAIVAAINSVGDTITAEEAREIVVAHRGDPEWVDNPPPWVELVNQALGQRQTKFLKMSE